MASRLYRFFFGNSKKEKKVQKRYGRRVNITSRLCRFFFVDQHVEQNCQCVYTLSVCIFKHAKCVYTLHHIAPYCTTLHHTTSHCTTLQRTATHRNTLLHTATHCTEVGDFTNPKKRKKSKSKYPQAQTFVRSEYLQTKLYLYVQHTATHCNTLHHIRHI